MKISNNIAGNLAGRIKVSTCPYNLDPKVETNRTEINSQDNLVVNKAQDVFIGLLKGDSGFLPKFITVGSGGDYEAGSIIDTGAYVPAAVTDEAMREVVYRIPIGMVTNEVDNQWTFVAIARPEEALAPNINEFGVETGNQTLISHVVSPPDVDGRATKYVKTSLEFLIVEWTYTFTLDLSTNVQPSVVNV